MQKQMIIQVRRGLKYEEEQAFIQYKSIGFLRSEIDNWIEQNLNCNYFGFSRPIIKERHSDNGYWGFKEYICTIQIQDIKNIDIPHFNPNYKDIEFLPLAAMTVREEFCERVEDVKQKARRWWRKNIQNKPDIRR